MHHPRRLQSSKLLLGQLGSHGLTTEVINPPQNFPPKYYPDASFHLIQKVDNEA